MTMLPLTSLSQVWLSRLCLDTHRLPNVRYADQFYELFVGDIFYWKNCVAESNKRCHQQNSFFLHFLDCDSYITSMVLIEFYHICNGILNIFSLSLWICEYLFLTCIWPVKLNLLDLFKLSWFAAWKISFSSIIPLNKIHFTKSGTSLCKFPRWPQGPCF